MTLTVRLCRGHKVPFSAYSHGLTQKGDLT